MATNFDRWEKDSFFSAAEEIQESTDRMESTYRTWLHSKKDASSMWDAERLRRDLHTALGTAKWQLDEFERAVRSSYVGNSNDDARDRHRDFIDAIQDNIHKVENSLKESALSGGRSPLAWVRLDEGERNELALFLSAPPLSEKNAICQSNIQKELALENGKGLPPVNGKISNSQVELGPLKAKNEEKSHGHRRTASANADIGAWKILIAEDGCQLNSSDEPASQPPRKVPSFSGFFNTMESATKFKLAKNGARKWKPSDCHHESDVVPLQSVQLSRGINAFYEKSKSCLDSCDESYDKQLHGWYGALQRQLQRSQYQMQYRRPVQAAIWITLLVCLILLVALRGL